jgi:hypothetical protein
MADAVTSKKIMDNDYNYIVQLTNLSDGTGESAVVKVDVSALSPVPTEVTLEKVHFSTVGMAVRLLWDASADVLAWEIPAEATGMLDFSAFGGLMNDSGSGKTGDVQLTTIGHTSGDTYNLVLECRKRYV